MAFNWRALPPDVACDTMRDLMMINGMEKAEKKKKGGD